MVEKRGQSDLIPGEIYVGNDGVPLTYSPACFPGLPTGPGLEILQALDARAQVR